MEDQNRAELRRIYFENMRFLGPGVSEAHRAALDRAHDLRRFEIENYWKRATYFWGFQLVAFTALALTAYRGDVFAPLVLPVAVLGVFTSLAAIRTARGSKFWQENWEAHVDFLEDEVEGQLHKIVLMKADLQPSVSKVNERLLIILALGWTVIFALAFLVILYPALLTLEYDNAASLQLGFALIALLAGGAWIWDSPLSDVKDRAFHRSSMKRYKSDGQI